MTQIKVFLVLRKKTDTLYCSMPCLVEDGGNIFEKLEQIDELDNFNFFQDWNDKDDPAICREESGSRWGYLCPICERPYEDVLA